MVEALVVDVLTLGESARPHRPHRPWDAGAGDLAKGRRRATPKGVRVGKGRREEVRAMMGTDRAMPLPYGPPHPKTWAKKFLWRTSWHNRWMQSPRGLILHRIAVVVHRERYFFVGIDGETVCGRKGRFYMPGICSRTGRPALQAMLQGPRYPNWERRPVQRHQRTLEGCVTDRSVTLGIEMDHRCIAEGPMPDPLYSLPFEVLCPEIGQKTSYTIWAATAAEAALRWIKHLVDNHILAEPRNLEAVEVRSGSASFVVKISVSREVVLTASVTKCDVPVDGEGDGVMRTSEEP